MRITDILFIAIGCAALLFTVYCWIPTAYFLHFKRPPRSPNPGDRALMLTFDDGPDPRYTERLLGILEKNGVRAVFFVVAEKAAQCPGILSKIAGAGHGIGLHSLEHRDAWLSGPAYQKKEFERSLAIMEGLGCKAAYYRAPWGHLNLTSLALARKHRLKIMLWTVMAQDWEKASTSQRILERLFKRVKGGSVICLHDAGGDRRAAPGAAEHTLQAVAEFVPLMLKKGFRFVLPEGCGAMGKEMSRYGAAEKTSR
ncbi:MAG TPA: polysaccharide deacetylase family protein [Clostridia bacterium]|nr:polysaccharide deacetylase family protein [Clostridia bacterium]